MPQIDFWFTLQQIFQKHLPFSQPVAKQAFQKSTLLSRQKSHDKATNSFPGPFSAALTKLLLFLPKMIDGVP